MARTLKQVIEDWERKNLVNVGTIAHAKTGRPVKPAMALQIARALGCTDDEVEALADALTASQAKQKRSA
jgi:hypothetical protein